MLNKFLYLIVVALIIGSCTPKALDPNANVVSIKSNKSLYYSKYHSENYGFTQYYATSSPISDYAPLKNPTARQKAHLPNTLLHSKADINYGKFDNDWRIPHTSIQANHKKYAETYWFPESEQQEAYMMLERYLFHQENTKEVQETIAFYTTWLLNNEAPQVNITQIALERLKGYWTKKQLGEAKNRLKTITEVHVIGFQAWRAEEQRKAHEQGKDYGTYFMEKQAKAGRGKMNPKE